MAKVSDFFDAMEKNGYSKGVGSYIKYNDDIDPDEPDVVEACAVGQAALNLKVDPTVLARAVRAATDTSFIMISIYRDNDNTDMTVPEIAQKYRELYKKYLDRELDI